MFKVLFNYISSDANRKFTKKKILTFIFITLVALSASTVQSLFMKISSLKVALLVKKVHFLKILKSFLSIEFFHAIWVNTNKFKQ